MLGPASGAALLAFSRKGKRTVAAESGLELRLEVNGLGVQAMLINRSGALRSVLNNSDLEPSRLMLTSSAGKQVAPFDERTRRKFDTSVSLAMYSDIAAGGSLKLEQARFVKAPDGYELSWGPFRFSEISAGAWKARLEFESNIDWITTGGKRVPAGKPVWKGKLLSNEVELHLP